MVRVLPVAYGNAPEQGKQSLTAKSPRPGAVACVAIPYRLQRAWSESQIDGPKSSFGPSQRRPNPKTTQIRPRTTTLHSARASHHGTAVPSSRSIAALARSKGAADRGVPQITAARRALAPTSELGRPLPARFSKSRAPQRRRARCLCRRPLLCTTFDLHPIDCHRAVQPRARWRHMCVATCPPSASWTESPPPPRTSCGRVQSANKRRGGGVTSASAFEAMMQDDPLEHAGASLMPTLLSMHGPSVRRRARATMS